MSAYAVESPFGAYGASELKRVFQRNWILGLVIAVMLHMTVIGTYFAVGFFTEEEPPLVRVRIMKYTDLPPPPSIMSSNVPPPVSISAPVAKPSIGAPVPVPDAEVSAEQTIATQREMSEAPAPLIEGSTGGDVVEVQSNIVIDDTEPPPTSFRSRRSLSLSGALNRRTRSSPSVPALRGGCG